MVALAAIGGKPDEQLCHVGMIEYEECSLRILSIWLGEDAAQVY
jgi:hypothetical protein